MRDTSLEAWDSIQDTLGSKQLAVLQVIQDFPEISDQEIAQKLGWSINRVTPRRGELLDHGRIEECGKKKGETGRSVIIWRVKSSDPQGELWLK